MNVKYLDECLVRSKSLRNDNSKIMSYRNMWGRMVLATLHELSHHSFIMSIMMDSLCCILTIASILLVLSSKYCLARGIMACLQLFCGWEKNVFFCVFNSINYDSKSIYIDEIKLFGFFPLQTRIKFSKWFCWLCKIKASQWTEFGPAACIYWLPTLEFEILGWLRHHPC